MDKSKLPPDIYAALYGPGWEKIPGTREWRELQVYYPQQPINAESWDYLVASWPESQNIEDRREHVPGMWGMLGRMLPWR